MASAVEICNRALQLLGASRIVSLSDASVNARACNNAYDPVRRAELRANNWNFSIKRARLPVSGVAPAFGRTNAFPLPTDYLRLLPPYPEDNLNSRDWLIEQHESQRCVLTDDSAPLDVRYVADVTDPNLMDALFQESLAYAMAAAMCEELTQSNSKLEAVTGGYQFKVAEAKRVNAIENVPTVPVEDTWVTVRV